MRSLRRTIILVGGLSGLTAGASAVVTGCSGDDTSMTDGGKDATTDQITPDGPQPDVLVDTGVDGGGGSDGGNNIQNFRVQVAQAFCSRFQNCCNNVDAGPFDYSTCVTGITKSGVEGSFLGIPAEVLNGPNIS